jgi:MFS family permease
MIGTSRIEESSLRYPGWRVVLACFLVEMFLFGFGLYGHAVYLAELQRLRGWPTALISTASTLSFLLGSLLAVFTNDALAWIGPKRFLLAGMSALAAATTLLAFTATPWQLYTAYMLMAFGWMGMGTVVIATILSCWFDHRRGLAISLAFNGATFGGIVIAPILVLLVGTIGFTRAMLTATAAMVACLLPTVICLVHVPAPANAWSETHARNPSTSQLKAIPAVRSRWLLLRSFGFWTISAPFALALLAQVGFIVHQIAILEPTMGRSLAALAVAVTATMAVIGRLCLGLVVDRLDPRAATAASVVTQAAALFVISQAADTTILFVACAVYGFSIGNLITLPPLIVHREFEQAAFATVLGLSTGIGGVISAFGPALIGLIREATGGYAAALMLCLMLKLTAAVFVLLRPRRAANLPSAS